MYEFSDIHFGKKVLTHIVNNESYMVDNDHGDIMSGADFVKRIHGEPDWDWRISYKKKFISFYLFFFANS